jgi:hypothetical protein
MRTSALVFAAALGAALAFLVDGFGFGFGFSTAQATNLPPAQMTCEELRRENHILWQILDRPSLHGEVYARE